MQPLTVRPMDLIYFLFFAVSHYPPQTETAALSMQVNPQAPPSGDVPVHLMMPLLSLAYHRPRAYLLYTGKFSLSQSIAPALGRPFQCIFSDGV